MIVFFSDELNPELEELLLPLSKLGAPVDDELADDVTATRADVVRTLENVLEPLTVTTVVSTALVLLETGGAVMDVDSFLVAEGGSEDEAAAEDVSAAVGVSSEEVAAAEDGLLLEGGSVDDGGGVVERGGVLDGVVEGSVDSDGVCDEEVSTAPPEEVNDDDGDAPVPIGVFWRLLFWMATSTLVAEATERRATRRRRRIDIFGTADMLDGDDVLDEVDVVRRVLVESKWSGRTSERGWKRAKLGVCQRDKVDYGLLNGGFDDDEA